MDISKEAVARFIANLEGIRFLLELYSNEPAPEFVTSAREIANVTKNMLMLIQFGEKDGIKHKEPQKTLLISEVMWDIEKYIRANKSLFPGVSEEMDQNVEGVIDADSVYIKRSVFNRIINDSGRSALDTLYVLRNNGQLITCDSQRGFEKVKRINGRDEPCINLKLCIKW